MPRLKYLKKAKIDLINIHKYLSRTSGDAEIGRAFVAKIQRKCDELAALPGKMGKTRPEFSPDARSFAFGEYVIFFRYIGDSFEVINVIEGH